MNDHIHFPILIDIAECKRDRYLIVARPNQVGTNVIDGFRRVARRQFNDNYLSMEIESDEMAGMRRAITVVTNNSIFLRSARIAIDDVVVFAGSPSQQR